MTPTPSQDETWLAWDQRTFAQTFWRRLLVSGTTRLPRWICECSAWLLALLFLFLLPRERRAIGKNFAVVLGPQRRWARLRLQHRLFYEWGLTLIEAFRIHVGQPLEVSLQARGRALMEEARAQGRGMVLVTCHLGSWHVAGRALELDQFPLHIVMRGEVNPEMRKYMESVATNRQVQFIDVHDDFTSSMKALHVLKQGGTVGLQLDRPWGKKSIESIFFGQRLKVPMGPALLSYVSGAPMMPTITVRVGHRRYEVACLGRIDPQRLPGNRQAELARLTAAALQMLEGAIRQHPEQWFNFFPVFESPDDVVPAD